MGLLWHAFQYISTGESQGWQEHHYLAPSNTRYLRRLNEESTLNGTDMIDVAFVMICIIMAGMASGLTQVRMWRPTFLVDA
jgi:hypothetical protein